MHRPFSKNAKFWSYRLPSVLIIWDSRNIFGPYTSTLLDRPVWTRLVFALWTVQFRPFTLFMFCLLGSSLLISGSSFDRPVLHLTVYFRSFGSTSITSKDRTFWPLAVHGTPQFKARLYGPQAMVHSTDNIPTTLNYFRDYNSNINGPFQLQWFFNFSCTNLVPNFPTSSFLLLPFPTTCDPPV